MTFTLLSELGRGGMGVVWRARDEETGQIVALKLLRAAYADDPDYLERFTRELELTRRIHSAHVVSVLGYGVREGLPYLALEYVDGPSLRELLKEHGAYGWPEARGLLAQVAQGLADAHAAGIVHRDVKPSNILLGSDGVAKLTDFGVSRGLDLTRVTGTSTMLGTPAYLAPEGPADERSDLYSLGCVAYELLAGAVPFEGRSYQEVILRHVREAPDLTKLPPEGRPVVGALLAKEPGQRPQSAAALLGLLAGTAGPSAAPAPAQARATPAPTVPRRRRRGALLAAAAIAVALLLVAVETGLTAHPGASPSPGAPAASPAVAVVVSAMPSQAATPGSLKPVPSASPFATTAPSAAATTMSPARGFTPTGRMKMARNGHTATLLADGRVLIAGGSDASAELFLPGSGIFQPTGSMSMSRTFATATRLANGSVLIAGGLDANGIATPTAELRDSATGWFIATGSISVARWGNPTATLLPNGSVLVAGGTDNRGDALYSAELYVPSSGRFVQTSSMTTGHDGATATLLPNGSVLIAGGFAGNDHATAIAELYDPSTGRFTRTGSMTVGRWFASAALLPSGLVLVAGGIGGNGADALASAELYDPTTGRFTATDSMAEAREEAAATILRDGRVLIAGGYGPGGPQATAEIYDPTTETFRPTGSMSTPRVDATATLLSDGRVLIAGGWSGGSGPAISSAELFR